PAPRGDQRLPFGVAYRRRGDQSPLHYRRFVSHRHRLRNRRPDDAVHTCTPPPGAEDCRRESPRCCHWTPPHRQTIRPRADQGELPCLTLSPPASSPSSAGFTPTKSSTSPEASSPPDSQPSRFHSTHPTPSSRSPHWLNSSATKWRSEIGRASCRERVELQAVRVGLQERA